MVLPLTGLPTTGTSDKGLEPSSLVEVV